MNREEANLIQHTYHALVTLNRAKIDLETEIKNYVFNTESTTLLIVVTRAESVREALTAYNNIQFQVDDLVKKAL